MYLVPQEDSSWSSWNEEESVDLLIVSSDRQGAAITISEKLFAIHCQWHRVNATNQSFPQSQYHTHQTICSYQIVQNSSVQRPQLR